MSFLTMLVRRGYRLKKRASTAAVSAKIDLARIVPASTRALTNPVGCSFLYEIGAEGSCRYEVNETKTAVDAAIQAQ